MSFVPDLYHAPDFSGELFVNAPEAAVREAPGDGIAPEGYHAMSIFPEYLWRRRAAWTACRSIGKAAWTWWSSAT